MIVDPDMPDHWKTRMLADLLEDELAPVYLLRLWGHCQNRKKSIFERLPPAAVKAICRFQGDANELESALSECGFISRNADGQIEVVGWAEHNANLWSAWENGKKGGRPKKPKENPRDNPEKPTGNPRATGRSPDEGDEGDEGEKPSGGKPPCCDHKGVIALYHEILPELKSVVERRWPGGDGESNLRARWKEDPDHQSLEFWRGFFQAVRTNPHWMGENERGWKADLRWLVKRANFDKVIERWADGS